MRETYDVFYRLNGVRYPETLVDPHPFVLNHFSKNALFHDLTWDGDPNTDVNRPYYNGYQKKKLVENVYQFFEPKGPFRTPKIAVDEMTRPWKRKNVLEWTLTKQPYLTDKNVETLIVINYNYLNTTYRWQPMKMTPYWRWYNHYRTIFHQADEIASVSDRNQFIMLDTPTVIQGKTIMDRFAELSEPTEKMALMIGLGGRAAFMELEFWRWIHPRTRKFSMLNMIKPENYGKINFVIVGKSGRSALINMAIWNGWIKGQPLAPNAFTKTQQSPETVQKLYLKLLMVLCEVGEEQASEEDKVVLSEKTGDQEEAELKPLDKTVPIEEETTDDFPVLTAYSDTPFEKLDEDLEELHNTDFGDTVSYASPIPVSKNDKTELKKHLASISAIDDVKIKHHPEISELTNIELDIKALDRLNLTQIKNSIASEDSDEEDPEERLRRLPDKEKIIQVVTASLPPEKLLLKRIENDAEANLLTASEYRKFCDAVEKYNNSEDPYGSEQPRRLVKIVKPEDRVLSAEDIKIEAGDEVVDKTMLGSSINAMNKKYIRQVYSKNMIDMLDAIQAAGVVIKEHEVSVETTVLGTYERHRVELKPIDGQSSVVQFTLPKVKEDGTYEAAGNKYLLRRQRVDLPIRKIAPTIVSLSTYYGKTFIQTNPKVANNSLAFVNRKINMAIVSEDSFITSVSLGDVFDNNFKAPFIYNALAHQYEGLKTKDGLEFFFNYRARTQFFDEKILATIEVLTKEKDGYTVICVGKTAQNDPITVDSNNKFKLHRRGLVEELGDIFDVLQFEREKAPVNFSEVRVFSKYIPVGIVMGYYIGLRGLLSLLDIHFRVVHARKNKQLLPDEFALNFKDVSLVFKDKGDAATMVIAGFQDYDKVTRLYDVSQFDHKDVYLNLLMSKKIGAIYVRELDLMETSFVDPISKQILETMKEPTSFKMLLIRATELLMTYHHPTSQDRNAMRDRGYERFSGAVYSELMRAIRGYKNKNMFGRGKIDMSPYEVWNSIMKDSSGKIAEDINPIQNLKESEVITFSGTGGRGKDSMTKPTRAFHRNDFGILSTDTVDSASVGTIAYMSANPNIADVYGLASKERDTSPTALLSTSTLLAPTVLTDNPKRIMFVNTQNSHTIASPAYKQGYLLTGYEYVIGKRTSKLFCTAAEEDGTVLSVTPDGIVVEYASGKKDGVELGTLYGRAEGTTYPHYLQTPMVAGQKFKKGDIIAYNKNFFEPSYNDPKKIIYKSTRCVNVAYIEKPQTHEDSSAISQKLSEMFSTEVTKCKSFVVEFQQNVYTTLKSGDTVLPSDVLLIIEDAITSPHGQFSSTSIETLKRLGNVAPMANVLGRVDRIEVYYHGDKQDMTMTLKKLADQSDHYLAKLKKSSNQAVVSGRVTDEYRVSGKPLQPDHAEIRVYISVTAPTGVGDKAIFGHQMKSTVAEVIPGQIFTEDGQEVDAIFSYKSAAARGVHSPLLMGTTITLLDVLGKRVINAYGD